MVLNELWRNFCLPQGVVCPDELLLVFRDNAFALDCTYGQRRDGLQARLEIPAPAAPTRSWPAVVSESSTARGFRKQFFGPPSPLNTHTLSFPEPTLKCARLNLARNCPLLGKRGVGIRSR